jgi:hypothetical protein
VIKAARPVIWAGSHPRRVSLMGEIVFPSVFLVGSAYLLFVAETMHRVSDYDLLGPGLWPQVSLAGVLLASLALVARGIWRYRVRGCDSRPFAQTRVVALVLAVTLSLAYSVGMHFLGFLLSTFLFQVAFLLIQGVRRCMVLVVPLGLTALLYGLFIKLMYLPLPRGVGIFRTISLMFY